MKTIGLKNGILVTENGFLRGDVILHDGRIQLSPTLNGCDRIIDIDGKYVLPGFVDIHTHGYGLFDITEGLYDAKTETYDNTESTYRGCLDMISSSLAEFGVTSCYLATAAASIEVLQHCLRLLAVHMSKTSDAPSR